MSLTRIGSIGINTGIAFAGVTTIVTLNTANDALSIGATVNIGSGNLTVGSGVTISSDGDGFFTGVITATSYSGIDLSDVTGATGDFSIADKIVHTGDTDTAIRFPNADVISFETAGADRFSLGTSEVVVNDPGNDIDFRIEGDSDTNLFKVDAGNDRIGIGEASPDIKLHVRNDNSAAVKIGGEGGSAYYMEIGQLASSGSPGFNATGSGASMLFQMAGSEKLRIGPSGQIGIGGANYGSSGQVLTSGGSGSTVTWSTVSGTTINNNADNRIITGSGTANTLEGEAGLTYNGQALNVNSVTSENNAFRVYNTSTSATTFQINGEGNSFIGHTYPRSDANIDLGFHTNYRWRDVVLSGGIRFGSSSADDYLDDYEEGTYTPTINVGTFTTFLTHRYVKIGRLVHLHGGLIFHNNSSGTRVEISNIPFAQQTGQQFVGNVWLRRTSTGERNWNMILGEAGTNIMGIFRDSNGNDMGGHLSYSDFQHSSTYFNYSITYISAT